MEVDTSSNTPEQPGTSAAREGGTYVTGGEYKNAHFGTQVHYHYHTDAGHQAGQQQGGNQAHGQQQGGSQAYGQQQQQQGGSQAHAVGADAALEDRLVPESPEGDCVGADSKVTRLTDNISATTDKPLSYKARVYPGVQKMGMFTRPIAVKIVNYSDKRMREARNLVKLTPHVNVVSIIHADIVPKSVVKTIYIVMDQCQPMSLESYYEKRKKERIPFNTRLALELARQALEGINHIHKNNIIHRDLKPSSFLFSLDGKNLKVIDFGLSKELDHGMTTMSVSTLEVGTDGFRAPETYNKDEIKRLADIFSLAIVVYHIWSYGLHPFGNDRCIWSYNIKSGKTPDLTGLLVPDRDNAEDLLKHMLEKEYRERYRIANVLNHAYISQGVSATLLHGMKKVWEGRMQVGSERNSPRTECIFYQREDQPGLGNDEQELKFRLNYFEAGAVMKMVTKNIDGKPDGFLSLPKDKYFSLMKELSNNKIGWIKVFKNNENWRAFLIFSPRGYEELYGVYVEELRDFINSLHERVRSQTMPKEHGSPTVTTVAQNPTDDTSQMSGARPKRPRSREESTNEPAEHLDSSTVTTMENQLDNLTGDGDDDYEAHQGTDRMPTEIGLPEYISWWFYKPAEQSSQN